MKDLLYRTLKKYFGYETFREYQEEIITSMLGGFDTVAIMPTGAGKSLCYQLPAMISKGTTIVVSPLISLMKDQVDYLENIGIPAVYLNSSLTSGAFRERLRGIYENQYRMIYVAPERLETEGFLQSINSLQNPCNMLIIDEAHCVSRWGHDFRPSYTKIIDFIKKLNRRPTIAAFTATATDAVRQDIEDSLSLISPNQFITGFDRENLEFKVFVNIDKERYIKEYIKNNLGDTGIIYTGTRKEAERLHGVIQQAGINSAVYHGGLSDQDRNQAQEDFIYDNVTVMVATNAFGMGIDKSNVRYVIHYNMPKDLESYYQEAGRAGRDGLPSVCILLYSAGDTSLQKYFIDEGELPEDRKALEYKKLQIMESYCHTDVCLRKYMLEYFGDYTSSENCGNCSVCNNETETKDVTLEAQMILSCINRSGQRFGKSIIIDTLRGSRNKRILSFRLNQLKTYGLMSNHSRESIELLMNKLIAERYIHKTEEQYPVLKLTEKSVPLLKNKGTVTMQILKKPIKQKVEEPLLAILKDLRKKIAIQAGYPPYLIFHDAALKEMSSIKPTTLDEFAYIKGVGENRKNKYGKAFLQAINSYVRMNQPMSPPPIEESEKHSYEYMEDSVVNNTYYGELDYNRETESNIQNDYNSHIAYNMGHDYNRDREYGKENNYTSETENNTESNYNFDFNYDLYDLSEQDSDSKPLNTNKKDTKSHIFNENNAELRQMEKKEPAYEKYALSFIQGKTIEDISADFGVTVVTVEKNIFKAYREGMALDLSTCIQKEYEQSIAGILVDDKWDGKLKYIKEQLPEEVTYQTIKAVIEKLRKRLYTIP